MRVVVCVKQVLDPRCSLEISEQGTINLLERYPISRLDPSARAALEQAMRIKEGFKNCEVIAISVGPVEMEMALRYCLARGVDRAFHIVDCSTKTLDGWAAAFIVNKLISKIDYQIVLCGQHSIDENAYLFGAALAEFLEIPHIAGVCQLEISSDGAMASVWRKLEQGDQEVLECPLPALLAVENLAVEPTYVSVAHYKAVFGKEIQRMGLDQADIVSDEINSPTQIVRLSPPRPRPKR